MAGLLAAAMAINLKLSHKGLILVSVPLLFELAFIVLLTLVVNQAEKEIWREVRARTVLTHVGQISTGSLDAVSAAAGYGVSRASMFTEVFADSTKPLAGHFAALQSLVSDPRQLATVTECKKLMDEIIAHLSKGMSLLRDGKELDGLGEMETGKQLQEDFRHKINELLSNQEKILQTSAAARAEARQRVQMVLLAGVVFNILLAFGLAIYFNKGTASRLSVLVDNTNRLANNEPILPVMTGDDEIGHIDKVFHDMADKLAEAARKERAIVDNAIDVICSLDAHGKFVRVSPASTKVWGYTPEELVGKRYTDLVIQQDSDKGLQEARKSLSGAPFESRVRRKDGAIVHTLWSAYWSPTENALFCVAHDITERKRAEEMLRASEERTRQIIESMPVGLLIIDDKGRIEMTNPATLEMFGYERTELLRKHIRMLFHEPKEDTTDEFMNKLFADSIGKITERDGWRKKGDSFTMELSLKEYLAKEGRRFLAIMLDVTERHELERLKQEFLAMVSHDLRSPLTSIQAFLMMLNEGIYGDLTKKGQDKAQSADRSATRLLALVNDLLDLDKLESGRFQMEFSNIPISSVIDRSLDALRAIAEKQGIVFETPKTTAEVYADGDRLVQVLVNLLGNAVKYSPPGESVVISVAQSDGLVEVRVTDKGRGIPPQLRDAIFEKFKQVDAKDHKQKGGSGLGLAIAKALIEQQAGSIGVDSEEGIGSSFWFKVPVAQANTVAMTEEMPRPKIADLN